jgi:hypothetical protein
VKAVLNSTRGKAYSGTLRLESSQTFRETAFSINPGEALPIEIPLAGLADRDYIFAKMYINNTLTDVSELILGNLTASTTKEKPFILASNITLNSSKAIYQDSAAKAYGIAPLLLLAASISINISLIVAKLRQ